MQEYNFPDANLVLALAVVFGGVALLALARLLWKGPRQEAWQVVLSIIAFSVAGLIGGLAARDCATKVASLRLATDPPSLTFERRWPRRTRVVHPGELNGIGIVSLGTTLEDETGGRRQLLLALPGEREIRSFLSREPAATRAFAESVAAAFGLELQRFAGPPPLKKDAEKR